MDSTRNNTKPISGRDRQRKYMLTDKGRNKAREYEEKPSRKYSKMRNEIRYRIRDKIMKLTEFKEVLFNEKENSYRDGARKNNQD